MKRELDGIGDAHYNANDLRGRVRERGSQFPIGGDNPPA